MLNTFGAVAAILILILRNGNYFYTRRNEKMEAQSMENGFGASHEMHCLLFSSLYPFKTNAVRARISLPASPTPRSRQIPALSRRKSISISHFSERKLAVKSMLWRDCVASACMTLPMLTDPTH